jgi:hypothetical protein
VKPGKRVRVQLLPGRPLRAPTVLSREGDAS